MGIDKKLLRLECQPINYKLKQVDYNGEYFLSDIIACSGSEFNSENILIYPNPVKNVINIFGVENAYFDIYSSKGEILKSNLIQNNKIDISEFCDGLYYILIKMNNNNRKVFKIIKNQ